MDDSTLLPRPSTGGCTCENQVSAAVLSSAPTSAGASPPMAAEISAATVKNTPTRLCRRGQLVLVSCHAANGKREVTAQTAIRSRDAEEEYRSEERRVGKEGKCR